MTQQMVQQIAQQMALQMTQQVAEQMTQQVAEQVARQNMSTPQRMSSPQRHAATPNRQMVPAVPHPVRKVSSRMTLHPQYVARRRGDGRSLASHALGTLLVVGALVLMANV